GASGNTVGGSSSIDSVTGHLSGPGNVISGNGQGGVVLTSASGSLVAGNFIGTDITGTVAISNDPGRGNLDNIDVLDGSSNNTIGGASSVDAPGSLSGYGNLISSSGEDGVFISDYNPSGLPVTNTLVQGNFIGTDVTGKLARGNSGDGIYIAKGASGVTI